MRRNLKYNPVSQLVGTICMNWAQYKDVKPPMRLVEDAANDYYNFSFYDDDCYCHNVAPCGICTHPGNPRNLVEDDDSWLYTNGASTEDKLAYLRALSY